MGKIIRIYHEYEGRIEKPICPEDRHLASQIFLSYPHTNNGFFFLLTTVFIYLFKNKLPEVPGYSKMQFHIDIT